MRWTVTHMVLSDLCPVWSGTVRSVSDLCPTDVRLCVRSCPKTMSRSVSGMEIRLCRMCMSDKLSPECPTTALLRVAAPSHICLCVHVGENRHGNLGTHSRDGDGDNPLLLQRTKRGRGVGASAQQQARTSDQRAPAVERCTRRAALCTPTAPPA